MVSFTGSSQMTIMRIISATRAKYHGDNQKHIIYKRVRPTSVKHRYVVMSIEILRYRTALWWRKLNIWITEDSQAVQPSFGKWHKTQNFCLIFFYFHQHITSHTHIYICTSFSKTLTVACVHAWAHACLYLSVCVCVCADTYKQVSFHSWKSWHTKRYYILNVKHIKRFFSPLYILWT